MSSSVSQSVHQGPSTDSEGDNTDWSQKNEEALVYYASQPNTEDTLNAGAIADAQMDMLQCMLATDISPFGEHILPCGEEFVDLDSLMIHLRDRHDLRGPDWMRVDCVWLTNGDHLCGENIGKSGYKRHISVHLGLRVVCEECNKSFSRKDTLNNHTKKKH